ncbi:MAG: hypothetical protein ACKOFX_09155 [Solirubrobacterales bacterium]
MAMLGALICLALIPAGAFAKPAAYKLVKGTYNARYCEIFLIDPAISGGYHADVYNTIGVNDCPEATWAAVDFTALATEQGVALAAPNGPRHWVLDAIGGRNVGPTVTLSGLEIRKVASAHFPVLPPPNFTELTINRSTQWIFNKGRRVRELIAPNGRRYVMQAYDGAATKTEQQLDPSNAELGPGYGLPDGWRYRTFKVKKRWVLPAPRKATIVRDGLKSVYQRYR